MYYLVSKITWVKGLPVYTEVKYLETEKDAMVFNDLWTAKQEVEYICVKPNEDKGDLEKVEDFDDPEKGTILGR